MEIQTLSPRGYCYGVVNAIRLALDVKQKHPNENIYLLGMIVHNQYIVDALENLGIKTIDKKVLEKINYVFEIIETHERISAKLVKHIESGLFEIRIEYQSNIYRIFFCFDEGKLVVLFNGFQKKTQKTARKEIEKALKIMAEYYEYKKAKN